MVGEPQAQTADFQLATRCGQGRRRASDPESGYQQVIDSGRDRGRSQAETFLELFEEGGAGALAEVEVTAEDQRLASRPLHGALGGTSRVGLGLADGSAFEA